MPRDSSGNYSLPAGNPVVDGTVIETTWANPTMADIADQLNKVLTRDGLLGMTTAPFKILAGSLSVPGIAFNDALTTGIYREAGQVSFGYNATRAFGYNGTSVNFDVKPHWAPVPTELTELTNKSYVDNAIASAVGGSIPGTSYQNAADIAGSQAITAAMFGTGIIRINTASVAAITLPTIAAMGLAATPGRVRIMAFELYGSGIPTFAGATSATSINGVVGPTVVTPLNGAPLRYQFVVLTQLAPGSDAWSLA